MLNLERLTARCTHVVTFHDAPYVDIALQISTIGGLLPMALLAVLSLDSKAAAAQERSAIKAGETVVVLPTAARLDPAGNAWTVPLHAWVFEREGDSFWRSITVAGFADLLRLPKGSVANQHFQERARDFLVDDKSGRTLELSVDGRHELRLPKTGGNGHAESEAQLPAADLPSGDGNPWLDVAVVLNQGDTRRFVGGTQLISAEGPSVISDIDDTIKISHVNDQRLLLESTFTKAFEAVPGMAGAYRSWQQAGAVFHYVSSSPWQLYPALAEFMSSANFPRGSLYLRNFRVKDQSFFDLFASPEKAKPPIIEALLEAYPHRDFFLVGDSGERDPEIYGATARGHPGRIGHIYIRLVAPEHRSGGRMEKAFAGLAPDLWSLFVDPGELPKSIGVR